MAESFHYNRSGLGGSTEADYSRSVLNASDEVLRRSAKTDYSRSVFHGSDEVREESCEPCQSGGSHTTAFNYCVDCSKFMCGPCCKHHMTLKAFCHHMVKDADALEPLIKRNTSSKMREISTGKLAKPDMKSGQLQVTPGNEKSSLEQNTNAPGNTKSSLGPNSNAPGNTKSSLEPNRNIPAYLVSTIDIATHGTDKILDVAVVQKHYCVVVFTKTNNITVVDTRKGRLTSEINLSDATDVFCITSVNDGQVGVAATVKDLRRIVILSVSSSGIISDIGHSIHIGYDYTSIVHSNTNLFYAAIADYIDVISVKGVIIRTLSSKSLKRLCGIALSTDNNTLYVCSFLNHTVSSVDLNGNVKSVYKDKDLKSPVSITVDSDGYVYVCSFGTKCVHQLTADLCKVQVVVKDVSVSGCAFGKFDSRLYLCCGKEVKVYSLNLQ